MLYWSKWFYTVGINQDGSKVYFHCCIKLTVIYCSKKQVDLKRNAGFPLADGSTKKNEIIWMQKYKKAT